MKYVTLCLFLILFAGNALAAERELPTPQTDGGISVFQSLETRASATGRDFPNGEISDEDLSTLLWAASGRNRQGKGWIVPIAMGKAPYCTVYVAAADGSYLYDGKKHSLRKVNATSIKDTVGLQSFVGKAHYVLIFVINTEDTSKLDINGAGEILTGAMTQNVYLAAQSLNIGVRYIVSLNEDAIRKNLHLKSTEKPVCILPMGSYK